MNILIPMAGLGSRFKVCGYEKPKPLIEVDGVPMIENAIKTLDMEGNYIFVIREYDQEENTKDLISCLMKIKPRCVIVKTKKLTQGAAETCLLAKKYIDNDEKLIITNCDQLMSWKSNQFKTFLECDYDGIVVTHDSSNPKNSFIALDENGYGKELREKEPISNLALIGLHYWKRGSDFVRSAECLIKNKIKEADEYYIAPTYNVLIKDGLRIKNYHLEKNEYHPIGTPKDLKIYIGKKNEFKTVKPKTIICDIDGTIIKHVHQYSDIKDDRPLLNEGVIEKFNEWDSFGHHIIVMTARKESARKKTEEDLRNIGIPYDQLIMGATSGQRVLINDKLTTSCESRAKGIDVITDQGFKNIKWLELGL